MEKPDERVFAADLASAEFRSGVVKGWWGLPDTELLPADLKWPRTLLWIAAAARSNAPDRYFFALDVAGYRATSPTGALWNSTEKARLELSKWPKGSAGTRFAKVFRTDWQDGIALYHPYDRVAASSHGQWAADQPHLVWTANHTIVDYLAEFHALLQSGDYVGA